MIYFLFFGSIGNWNHIQSIVKILGLFVDFVGFNIYHVLAEQPS